MKKLNLLNKKTVDPFEFENAISEKTSKTFNPPEKIEYETYNGNYHVLRQPQFCNSCNKKNEHPKIIETDTINGYTCEADVYCQYCNEFIKIWSYGYFLDNIF